MMKFTNAASTALIMGAMLVALSACERHEGSAERAGKEIDKTSDKLGQQIEKAGQNIQDAAKGDKK